MVVGGLIGLSGEYIAVPATSILTLYCYQMEITTCPVVVQYVLI